MSDSYGGRIEGKFDVDGNGGATYTIPVMVPPGTGGLQPSLQLVYNSHLGELGPLGAGWRLGGLSSISRVAATIAQDGVIGRVEYGAADRFALDGARLMAVEGEYGAANAVYRTEVEQWMKVVPGAASVAGRSGPDSFTAYAKDRTRYVFGGTEDSRVVANAAAGKPVNPSVRTWLVNQITDRNGNVMTVRYDRDPAGNNAYPAAIEYGGNERTGLKAQREVRFTYTALPADSPDAAPQFSGGYAWSNRRLLESISTYVSGELVLTYRLAYARDGVTRRSRITSITVADAKGRALPATTFQWQDGQPSFFGPPSTAILGGGEPRGSFIPMDVNGDGLVDIVNAYEEDRQLRLDLYLGRLDGTFAPPVSVPVTGLAWDAILLPLDIDADGCTDLVHARSDRDELALTVFHARQEGGLWTLKQGPVGGGGPKGLRWSTALIALDFDGDGRIDLVHGSGENGDLVIRPLRSNGTAFEHDPKTKTVTDLPWRAAAPLIPLDFDGDGKGDLAYARSVDDQLRVRLLRSDGKQFQPLPQDADIGEVPYGPVLFSMDANGDGKPDLVAARISRGMLELRTMLSNGMGLERPQLSTFPVKADALPRLIPARLTGGPPDLIVQTIESDVPALRVFSSNGGTFVERSGVAQPFAAAWTGGMLLPADIDGDGRTDLLAIGRASKTDRRLTFTSSRVTGAIPDLVRRVTDGYGEQVSIEYKPLTDSTVYRKSDIQAGANADPRALLLRGISGSTFDLVRGGASAGATHSTMSVQFAKQVVAAYERPGSGTQRFRFERFYAGARVDLEGRGWLGFSRMEIIDRDRNTRRITTYRQDFPFGGAPRTTELRRASDDRLFELGTYEQSARVRDKVHEPQLLKKERAVFGGPNPSSTPDLVESNEMEYDDYGNVTLEVIRTTGAAQTKPLFVHHVIGDYDVSSWNLGLERETKRTSDRAGTEVLSHRRFKYDGRANRVSDETWDDVHRRWLETKYEHDDYGNETSLTTASGAKTSTEYEQVFRSFPLHSTQPANDAGVTLVVDHQYDPRFGVEISTSQPHLPGDRAPRTRSRTELDGLGRVVAKLGPNSSGGNLVTLRKTSRGRDATGPFEEEQVLEDWEGTSWRTERRYFTAAGQVFQTRVLGPDGTRETVVDRLFDSDGRTLEETLPRYAGAPARTVRKTYDVLARMIRLERPLPGGRTTIAETKCLSATVEESTEGVGTPSARVTLREYGYFGGKRSIVKRVDALGGETKFEYDALARSTRVTDPKGVVTIAAYDSVDRQTSLEVRAGDTVQSSERTEFDDVKRESAVTDARGIRVRLRYDALNRLVRREAGEDQPAVYAYDDPAKPNTLSRLARVDMPDGVRIDYDYDDQGNRTFSALTLDGATHAMRSSYTPAANIEHLFYPDGSLVRNVYNAAGSLTAVEDAHGSRYATYGDFSPFGKAQAVSLRNGTREDLPYNDVGQLAAQTITGKNGKVLARTSIRWNDLYQLDEIRDEVEAKRTQSFTYDKVGRLLRATGDHEPQEFAYDPAGNLTKKGAVTFTVAGHQVRSGASGGADVFRAEYDAAGNVISTHKSGEHREFRFNALAQLVESNGTTFVYDHEGARIAKKSANGAATYYVGSNFEVTTFPGGARQRTAYIAGGHGILASVTTSETAAAAPPLHGVPAAGTYFFHTNHINSTTFQTDANGDEVCRVEYLPFGEIHRITGRDIFRQKFTGSELDYETGLYYLKSRYYDPSIGRFISSDDRLGGAVDRHDVFNRYAYVLNNPVSEFDPEGHSAGWAIFSGVMFGLAVIGGVALTVATGGMAAGAVATGLSMLGGVLIGGGMSAAMYSFSHMDDSFDARRMGIEFGIGAACGVVGTGTSALGLKAAGVALKFGEAAARVTLGQALAIAAIETVSGALVGGMAAMLKTAADQKALDWNDVGIKTGWGAAGGLLSGATMSGSIRTAQQAVPQAGGQVAAIGRGAANEGPVKYVIPKLSDKYVNQAAQSVFFNGPRGAFSAVSKQVAAGTGPQPATPPRPQPAAKIELQTV